MLCTNSAGYTCTRGQRSYLVAVWILFVLWALSAWHTCVLGPHRLHGVTGCVSAHTPAGWRPAGVLARAVWVHAAWASADVLRACVLVAEEARV
eukprot:358013-Chlamydomonas_euryale.AAC.3